MEVDPETDELYIADGYYNKRVLVVDAHTGMYKRHWGAYGNVPDDTPLGPYNPADPPAQQFRNPVHRVRISNDGLVYVADRQNNRIQVFEKDGTFVKEFFIDRNALGAGSACELDFSNDKRQKYIYVADSVDNVVWVLLRETGEILKTIGRGGRNAGQFKQSHSVAVDSKGNLYVGEVDTGARIQKFKHVGNFPVD
jgi:DNA-binding beta-propeller fold protein YncE